MPNHFTREKDSLLKNIIQICGARDWVFIANEFNRQLKEIYGADTVASFTPRQCRERWNNYLNDASINMNREWSEEENRLLIQKYQEYGCRWSAIAQFFPYRTTVSVKNHYIQLQRSGIADLYIEDADYDSDDDDSPTFRMTKRQTYCPSSLRPSTKQQMYFTNCTARNQNCRSTAQCYFPSGGGYQTCPNARFSCAKCNKSGLGVSDVEIDHINPVSNYLDRFALRKTREQIADWYNDTNNLQILCIPCNRKKSDKT